MSRHVPGWRAAADRVRRLAATLTGLRDRVREAVVAETGKAVADAVRDQLTAALGGKPADPPAYHRPHRRDWDDEDDERDRWDDESDDEPDDDRPGPTRPGTGWPVVIATAAGAVRWWAARNLPAWVGAALGAVAAAVVIVGGDVARAGTAVLTAAADLLPLTA